MDNTIVLHTIVFFLCSLVSGIGMVFWLTGHISLSNILDIIMPTVFISGIILFKNGDLYFGKIHNNTTAFGSGTIAGVLSVFIGGAIKKLYKKDPLKSASIIVGKFNDKAGEALQQISELPDKDNDNASQ